MCDEDHEGDKRRYSGKPNSCKQYSGNHFVCWLTDVLEIQGVVVFGSLFRHMVITSSVANRGKLGYMSNSYALNRNTLCIVPARLEISITPDLAHLPNPGPDRCEICSDSVEYTFDMLRHGTGSAL